jgi:hypothetical protein
MPDSPGARHQPTDPQDLLGQLPVMGGSWQTIVVMPHRLAQLLSRVLIRAGFSEHSFKRRDQAGGLAIATKLKTTTPLFVYQDVEIFDETKHKCELVVTWHRHNEGETQVAWIAYYPESRTVIAEVSSPFIRCSRVPEQSAVLHPINLRNRLLTMSVKLQKPNSGALAQAE